MLAERSILSEAGFLLDTNVISESRRNRPEPNVTAFLRSLRGKLVFLSVLTLGELRKGVAGKRMSDPGRADRLSEWIDSIEALFAGRLLSVDAAVARVWGELSARRSLPVIDTLIAATALAHNLSLVTRNTRDVKATGVSLIDPWT